MVLKLFSRWKHINLAFICILFFLFENTSLFGQGDSGTPKIEIIKTDLGRKRRFGEREVDELVGNVVLKHLNTTIYCDSAKIEGLKVNAFGNIVIEQDSLQIFGNTLTYDGTSKMAQINGNVVLDNNGKQLYTDEIIYDAFNKIANYTRNATLHNGQTQLKSRQGTYFVNTGEAIFKEKVVVVDPEVEIKTEYLKYNARENLAYFNVPTLLSFMENKSRIYTENGYYNMKTKIAVFDKKPQYEKGKTKSQARIMIMDGQTNEVKLFGEAYYQDSTQTAKADTIIQNSNTKESRLIGNAYFKNDKQEFRGKELTYNNETQTFKTVGRSKVVEGATSMEADDLKYDGVTGKGSAFGKFIYIDTVNKFTLNSDTAFYNKKTDFMKAFGGKVLITMKIEEDTLFITADTFSSIRAKVYYEKIRIQDSLYKASLADTLNKQDTGTVKKPAVNKKDKKNPPKPKPKVAPKKPEPPAPGKVEPKPDTTSLPKDSLIIKDSLDLYGSDSLDLSDTLSVATSDTSAKDDSSKLIMAWHDVRIYRKNLQSLTDSLSFSTADSIFRLYYEPIMWLDTTQLSGDTIHFAIKNQKVHRLDLIDNALIINTTDQLLFNQTQGRKISIFFEGDTLNHIFINGNVKTIYYDQDNERSYKGVIQATGSTMKIWFSKGEAVLSRLYDKVESSYSPMKSVDNDAIKLKGFKWEYDVRPKSKADLFLQRKLRTIKSTIIREQKPKTDEPPRKGIILDINE